MTEAACSRGFMWRSDTQKKKKWTSPKTSEKQNSPETDKQSSQPLSGTKNQFEDGSPTGLRPTLIGRHLQGDFLEGSHANPYVWPGASLSPRSKIPGEKSYGLEEWGLMGSGTIFD